MKQSRILACVLASAMACWAGYRIYLARADLVTLNVRNMDVRKVVSKIEWQTWEQIVLNTNVVGNVTLNVRRVPLTEVLNILALQTASRWTALYPIYSKKTATQKFEKVVRGEIPPEGSGWSNLEKTPGWRNGGGSAFGNAIRSANDLVSAQIENKDLDFAALALSRFSKAQVVPEDGALGKINLKLDQAPFATAVAQVAKQAHRKWDKIFTLQPLKQVTIAMNMNGPPGTNDPANPPTVLKIDTNVIKAPRQLNPEDQQRQMEAFLSTMTPAERQKAEEQLTTMQQINSLPEGERQQKMQEMAAQAKQSSQADREERISRRLRDGTTEQRISHDREMLKRNQQPQQSRQ